MVIRGIIWVVVWVVAVAATAIASLLGRSITALLPWSRRGVSAIGIADIQDLAEEHESAALAHALGGLHLAEGDEAVAFASTRGAIVNNLS